MGGDIPQNAEDAQKLLGRGLDGGAEAIHQPGRLIGKIGRSIPQSHA